VEELPNAASGRSPLNHPKVLNLTGSEVIEDQFGLHSESGHVLVVAVSDRLRGAGYLFWRDAVNLVGINAYEARTAIGRELMAAQGWEVTPAGPASEGPWNPSKIAGPCKRSREK
jgi:hypothetical protein